MNTLSTKSRSHQALAFKIFAAVLFITSIQLHAQPACDAQFAYYSMGQADSLHFYPLTDSPHAHYHWNFGDGTGSTEHYPWHRFATSGTYIVCLTVTDSTSAGTCTDTWCDTVYVNTPPPPICNAQFAYYSMTHADSLHFYPLTDSPHAQYHWNFGDGTGSTEHFPWHRFATSGTYIVCLTVTDSTSAGSCTDTWCDTLYVTSHVKVYPNPVNDNVSFSIPGGAESAVIAIHDDKGNQVFRHEATAAGNLTVPTDGLSSGVYFYFVTEGENIIATGKFMVLKNR
jgi:PKD repeat protein